MAQQRTVSVKVSLLAQDYFTGLKKMQDETRKTGSSAEVSFNKQKAAFSELGRASLIASGVFTAAFVAMVKASADFEQRMSQVQALSKATSSQMDKLRSSAFTAGKAFGLSATQVADAQIELTKAGVSVKDIIGGALPGALALAAAGQIDVGKATEIASNAMTQFGLKGKDVPHVADLLAASADKSVASVESLGDALNQSGLVASQFGLSAEDTVGTLTAFSKAGLNGSDAGTSFKTMLLSLASPSKQAQKYLDEYNITAYDSQGAFVGITNLADQLHDKLGKVSDAQRNAALSTIFGTDAIRGANVLYEQGGKKLQGFIDGNNEAGFAALQASKKLDNLNGDVQKLGATFQNDLIKSGSAGNDALRGVAQTAGNLLTVFGDLPKPIQGSALALTAVGAAVTAGAAAFLLITPRVAAAKAAMADLNLTAKGTAIGFAKGAGLAVGIAAVTSGLANLASQGEVTEQQLNLAAKSAKSGFGNIDGLFKGDAFNGIKGAGDALRSSFSGNFGENLSGTAKFIDGLSFGITHLADTYKSNEGQFKAIGEQLGALANQDYTSATGQFDTLVKKLGGGTEVAKEGLKAFPGYREEIVKLLNASGQAATEQNVLAAAMGRGGVAAAIQSAQNAANQNAQALNKMSGSAVDARVDISALAKTISGFGSVTLDARSAQRAFEQAVDDASDAAKKNGRTLDISSQKGRDNSAALDGIASSASAAASKILEQSGSTAKAAAAMSKGRGAFIRAAESFGLSADQAKRLADNEGLIPGNVSTAVKATGFDTAISKALALRDYLNSLHSKAITIDVSKTGNGANFSDSRDSALNPTRKAAGGSIEGPGLKGKDSVLAYLAPGEHVLTAKEVDKMGGQSAVYAFRKGIQAYAKGGAIGESSAAAAAALTQVNRYTTQLAQAKRAAAAAEKRADALAARYDKASDAAANMDGSGSKAKAAAKKAAERRVRDLKNQVDAAKKRAEKASDPVDRVAKLLDDAKQARESANQTTVALRNDREDFVSTQRRATPDNPIDPLNYVDQLRSMSRDDKFSQTRRTSFDKTANKYETSLVKQQTALDKATKSLEGFKDAADSMRSGIASAITGGFQASNVPKYGGTEATTATTESGWIVRNGIRMKAYNTTQVAATEGSVTAEGIDAYYAKGKNSSGGFALDLQALANRGVNGKLLAEIAGYGVEQGGPIAKALLSGTSAQIASINTNYSAIQDNGNMAAGVVTDYNYKALIDGAQKNTDQITAQIASDGEKLRKLIAGAFGVTGYAVGTMAATPGWHLVGEKGPELLRFAGGEQVATAARTRAMVAAAQGRSSMSVSGPSSVTIVDADGTLIGHFAAAARGVARQEIAADAHSDSVQMFGGAA
jgi:TP901 family phage tail tape measure protein